MYKIKYYGSLHLIQKNHTNFMIHCIPEMCDLHDRLVANKYNYHIMCKYVCQRHSLKKHNILICILHIEPK